MTDQSIEASIIVEYTEAADYLIHKVKDALYLLNDTLYIHADTYIDEESGCIIYSFYGEDGDEQHVSVDPEAFNEYNIDGLDEMVNGLIYEISGSRPVSVLVH